MLGLALETATQNFPRLAFPVIHVKYRGILVCSATKSALVSSAKSPEPSQRPCVGKSSSNLWCHVCCQIHAPRVLAKNTELRNPSRNAQFHVTLGCIRALKKASSIPATWQEFIAKAPPCTIASRPIKSLRLFDTRSKAKLQLQSRYVCRGVPLGMKNSLFSHQEVHGLAQSCMPQLCPQLLALNSSVQIQKCCFLLQAHQHKCELPIPTPRV